MTQKSSRFQRVALAHQVGRVHDELVDWARIYDGYANKFDGTIWTQQQADRYAERAEQLEELAMQLKRVELQILAIR